MDDTLIWDVRAFIYHWFVQTAQAPRAADIARQFDLTEEEARQALQILHDKHALFLEPGTTDIRIANPFSAVPTPYRVAVNGREYIANCAWDSFGIPAALGAAEAVIRAECAQTGAPIELRLSGGQVASGGELVHFLVPFRQWYDDLVFT